jgi:hypothetical protein
MRSRALDANGDYRFGAPFLTNVPAVVAQAAMTRLLLWRGEWFADTSDGTPYAQSVLGVTAQLHPDVYIKQRILETPGVNAIVTYSSVINPATRLLSVTAQLDTVYGLAPLQAVL